jgi:hypothetical protein
LICGLAACAATQSSNDQRARSESVASAGRTSRFDVTIRQLATLEGEFTSDWDFSGDKTILRSVGALSDSGAVADTAVTHLAACIGRTELARATFRGRAIPLGVVCYAALRQLAYHEETDETGHLTPYWPGFLDTPGVTAEQLVAARRAWLKAAREGSYHTL